MGDFGLLKQGWKWIQYQKQAFAGTRVVVSCSTDKLAFLIDRHWPMLTTGFVTLVRLALMVLLYWRDCTVKGFWSMASLGTTGLFVIMWSCFLSFTSASCLIYALFGLVMVLFTSEKILLPKLYVSPFYGCCDLLAIR